MNDSVWTVAEQSGGRLRRVSFELLARGRALADKLAARRPRQDPAAPAPELCSLVLGARIERADLQEMIHRGADRVLLVESPVLEHALIEPHANAIEKLVRERKPGVLIAGATSLGRALMPYLAIRLTTGLTADCTGLDIDEETGGLIQTRPAIGGNILATIVTARRRPQMATVRPRSTRPPEPDPRRQGEIETVEIPPDLLQGRVEWVGFRGLDADEANIQDADKIVAGGRGLKKADHFALIRDLAGKLKASVGASRETVDRGWVSYPHQVGLSGKTVSPRLYVAVGISGAIQHLAGMKTSDAIVAVNSDPDAQIFQVADFGVVGDLFEFLPALMDEIERRGAARATSAPAS